MTKRWPPAVRSFSIRFGWLALFALAVQLLVIYVPLGSAGEIRRFAFPASYVLLLAFVFLNRSRVGFLVIGAGMMLNFLAIVSNGGLMPVSPASMERAGLGHELVELAPGDAVPDTKNVLLEEGDTNLRWLSDRFTWGSPGPFPVFSAGDAVIAVGLGLIVAELLLPAALNRVSGRRPSALDAEGHKPGSSRVT